MFYGIRPIGMATALKERFVTSLPRPHHNYSELQHNVIKDKPQLNHPSTPKRTSQQSEL